ncbi:hypothetical protein HDF16_005329 [Granulicella aggregans]|uniref:Uncharacterized protein n=1 Tax=Granulicella aggregans TaxID=474949 RepID=A0A7W7ZIP7_9BACT|nr:hypothetical protein [Granulicella aggregans]MBB5060593.1 hypothetical protein [Granulicella aggregans]
MIEEHKRSITCLVFLGSEFDGEVFKPEHYWLQSVNKAWKRPAPFRSFDREDALAALPTSIRLFFEPLEPAMIRGKGFWVLRLGMTEMDEDELDREWISVPHPAVVFREPVDEGDDCVPGLDVPDLLIH